MKLADHGRQNVRVHQVVAVAGAIQVGGHGRQVAGAVLAVVAPAHFDAGDLGQGVRPVGGLQGTGEEVFLFQRLGRELGVDAARTQEQQTLDVVAIGGVDGAVLDGQIVADEVGRVGVVGDDSADSGCRQEHMVRLFPSKKGFGGRRIDQVEFSVGPSQQVGVTLGHQVTHEGRADQAEMARHVDFRA